MIEFLQALGIVLMISSPFLAAICIFRRAGQPDEHAGKGDGAGIG